MRATFLGFPIIRSIIFLGPYWGPHILGNYNIITSLHCLGVVVKHVEIWDVSLKSAVTCLAACNSPSTCTKANH